MCQIRGNLSEHVPKDGTQHSMLREGKELQDNCINCVLEEEDRYSICLLHVQMLFSWIVNIIFAFCWWKSLISASSTTISALRSLRAMSVSPPQVSAFIINVWSCINTGGTWDVHRTKLWDLLSPHSKIVPRNYYIG